MKALVTDDDFVGREKIKATLEKLGECTSVSSGELALKMFERAHLLQNPYDLITMDIDMPGLNGHDVMRRIRDWEQVNLLDPDEQGVKIIVITGMTDTRNALLSFRVGCQSYILKPMTHDRIRVALQELGLLDVAPP